VLCHRVAVAAPSTHNSSRLENLEDLAVDALERGGVARRLDSVHGVERVLAKLLGKRHKVALDERDLVRETGLGRLLARAEHLELIVVDADNVAVRERGNLTGGTTDTAANVKDTHTGAKTDHGREVVLVAGEGLQEGLALVEAAEVERVGCV